MILPATTEVAGNREPAKSCKTMCCAVLCHSQKSLASPHPEDVALNGSRKEGMTFLFSILLTLVSLEKKLKFYLMDWKGGSVGKVLAE